MLLGEMTKEKMWVGKIGKESAFASGYQVDQGQALAFVRRLMTRNTTRTAGTAGNTIVLVRTNSCIFPLF